MSSGVLWSDYTGSEGRSGRGSGLGEGGKNCWMKPFLVHPILNEKCFWMEPIWDEKCLWMKPILDESVFG